MEIIRLNDFLEKRVIRKDGRARIVFSEESDISDTPILLIGFAVEDNENIKDVDVLHMGYGHYMQLFEFGSKLRRPQRYSGIQKLSDFKKEIDYHLREDDYCKIMYQYGFDTIREIYNGYIRDENYSQAQKLVVFIKTHNLLFNDNLNYKLDGEPGEI